MSRSLETAEKVKRKIETNEYDSNNNLQEKIKVHYSGLSTLPNKIINYNKNGEETQKAEAQYTWFDAESSKVATKKVSSISGDWTREEVFTYNTSGETIEIKFSSFFGKNPRYVSESIMSWEYDSTEKVINSFFESRQLPDEIEYKPYTKTVYEYEYYNEG